MEYVFNLKEYRKKINKHNFLPTLIMFLIIFSLTICLIFLSPKKKNVYEFYFVELSSFSGYKQAENFADICKQNGCAGYILYDKKYHVLASFYPSKNDAEKVSKNIKDDYPNATVYTLRANKFIKNKNYTDKQNSVLKTLYQNNINAINELYNLSIEIDTDISTYSQNLIKIKDLKSKLKTNYDEFINSFNKPKFNTQKDDLTEIIDSLNSIEQSGQSDIARVIKFELCNIVLYNSYFFSCV